MGATCSSCSPNLWKPSAVSGHFCIDDDLNRSLNSGGPMMPSHEPSTWRCDGVAARPGDRATHGAAGREGGVALREGRRRHACAGCCHGSRGSDQSACRTTSSANHYTYVFMWSHAQQNRGTELTWVSRQRAALLLASRCEYISLWIRNSTYTTLPRSAPRSQFFAFFLQRDRQMAIQCGRDNPDRRILMLTISNSSL